MDKAKQETLKKLLRVQVETFMDFQRERIAFGNRLLRHLQEQGFSGTLRDVGKLEELPKEAHGIISPVFVREYFEQYKRLKEQERQAAKLIEKLLDYFPVWGSWLRDIPGVGPVLAGYLVAWLDPHKAPRPSSFWRYAGLHVVDGQAPKLQRGKKADWNTRLRAKLLGVLGPQFLRTKGRYRKIYDSYRNRLEHHPAWKDRTKAHKYRAAIRYTVKMFLKDLWEVWRELEGLPVVPDYAEAKLQHRHGGAERFTT